MSSNELNNLLSSITEGDLKETIHYEESETNSNTYYADLLNDGNYLVSQDENYLSIYETPEEAINEVKRLSKA